MVIDDALRIAGGAGGVDHHRRIVGGRVGSLEPVARAGEQGLVAVRAGRLAVEFEQLVETLTRGDAPYELRADLMLDPDTESAPSDDDLTDPVDGDESAAGAVSGP